MAAAKTAAKKPGGDDRKVVAKNRRARHEFHILDTYEAGMALVGTEVKSLRGGTVTISDAYVQINNGRAELIGMTIPQYAFGNINNHQTDRTRALLLHKKEIEELTVHVTRKGNTIVPLQIYFTGGKAKLEIAVAKGKDKGDKRQAIAERDTNRQMQREMKQRDY